jgi:hypothetical protein
MVNRKSRGALLAEANEILANGGIMRFIWATCQTVLVKATGELRALDGRTYDSLRNRSDLTRIETGSTETKDLVIEWRKH